MDEHDELAEIACQQLIREFELEGRRMARLADVTRRFGDTTRADQMQRELDIIDRKIHYLKTGEFLAPTTE